MKVNYKKTIEVNDELKSTKQQDDIKHLNDEDKVQKIPAASNPMKKKKPVCVICNQIFAMERCFKKPEILKRAVVRSCDRAKFF